MTDLNIIFAGTPAFAASHLQALLDAGLSVCAVYTQPDRASGRGKKLKPSPVKELAQAHDLPVQQPDNFKSVDAVETLAAYKPDLMIVVAYGLILPKNVLSIPRLGCINVHASLLPRWRGAAPVERAIEAGDPETGITIMQMDEGLDTGDMLLKKSLPVDDNTTGDSLRESLLEIGGRALVEAVAALAKGDLQGQSQDDTQACYAQKLSKAEAHIDWQQPAETLARKIRAFNSSNVCFASYRGERIKLWLAEACAQSGQPGEILSFGKTGLCVACGQGSLNISELQLPNSRKMPVSAIINGRPDFFTAGDHLE